MFLRILFTNILGILKVLGFVWLIVGTPISLSKLLKNGKKADFNKKLWLWVGLGGLGLLIVVFALNTLQNFLDSYFAVTLL
jgi:ABC-type dipeptide/oligopeptide/nickel transport system permease subunit